MVCSRRIVVTIDGASYDVDDVDILSKDGNSSA